MNDAPKGPVLFDLEEKAGPSDGTFETRTKSAPDPAAAPPVPDVTLPAPQGQAMQTLATLAARPASRVWRVFWGALLTLVSVIVSVAAWDFATALLARNAVLGWSVTALVALVLGAMLLISLREAAAFSRLRRLDRVQSDAASAIAGKDLDGARKVADQLEALYRGRDDLTWGRDRFAAQRGDMFDADALFALAENELLAPIDRAAEAEIEAAARQVATVTAIVPLALADLITALTANLRMIRRIAELYGGRSGALGSWRLTRTVLTHLVATGAVAVGDDLIGSIAGGGVLSKLSRRFGEGVVNGALTARVGVAALEVCRPLAFSARSKPSVTGMVKRALTGLFGG